MNPRAAWILWRPPNSGRFLLRADRRRARHDGDFCVAYSGRSRTTRRPDRGAGWRALARPATRWPASRPPPGAETLEESLEILTRPRGAGSSNERSRRSLRLTLRKLALLFRRDFAVARSYRAAFLIEIFQALFGCASFYFLSRFVESPGSWKNRCRKGTNYFSFALVGLAFFDYLSVALTHLRRKPAGSAGKTARSKICW